MTRPALPDHWQELMAGYALGDLSPEEAEELQRILTEHPELSAEVASLQDALSLMPYGLPQQDPPSQLRNAILSAAQTIVQAETPLGSGESNSHAAPPPVASAPASNSHSVPFTSSQKQIDDRPRRRSIVQWRRYGYGIGGAIAAAALFALGIDNYRLRQENQQSQAVITALQQRGTLTYALEGTEQANSASGSLVVADGKQVIILAKNLPVLPQGQVYRLWAMPPSGTNPTYCGQFDADRAGNIATHWLAPATVCQSTTVQMLITSEKASDPPVPRGSLVMKSRI